MKYVVIILALRFGGAVLAQDMIIPNAGLQLRMSASIGSHASKIGIGLHAYYQQFFYQINAGSSVYWLANGVGGRTNFYESRHSLGLLLMGGRKNQAPDFELAPHLHQGKQSFALGYSYHLYHDLRGSTQLSGAFVAHIKQLVIYHENDAFAGLRQDRFRTAFFSATYRHEQIKYSAGLQLWTGETKNSSWQKIPGKEHPHGFRMLEDLPFGKTSHGIAFTGVQMNGPYGQVSSLRLGVDSEEIRHTVQNKLFHDLPFMPKDFKRTSPHYPRLGDDGCAVFSRKERRKDRIYIQLGLNDDNRY